MTNPSDLIKEIRGVYQKHGWILRRALMRPETRAQLQADVDRINDPVIREAEIDALWFSRPSQRQREAWELRLVAETPYALFQTFEADETEEQRDEVRQEMEARMREYLQR